jgi:hypothetical protein
MDAAEFSALDCEVAAQLDLPCTLIGGVFSTHPIKRHISRVSRPIKLPNTLIVSPIRDRVSRPIKLPNTLIVSPIKDRIEMCSKHGTEYSAMD